MAVLAELVKLRQTLRPVPTEVDFATSATEAMDPICGMTVNADNTSHPFEVDGETFYFCCLGCRSSFEDDGAEALLEGARHVD